jgi:hypothetical protein
MLNQYLKMTPLLLAIACKVSLAQLAPSLDGVWKGTLGNLGITACFNPDEMGTQVGSYYYQKNLEPIHLSSEKQAGLFTETGDAMTWRLSVSADGSQLNGTWTKLSSAKSPAIHLPIVLKPVKLIKNADSEGNPCANGAYLHALIQSSMPLIYSAEKRFQGNRYVSVKRILKGVGHVETIQLLGDGQQYQRLNALFLEKARPDYFQDCMIQSMQNANNGEMTTQFGKISVWGSRWFVATARVNSYCGGAHPNDSSRTLTYDLSTGALAPLRLWFNQPKAQMQNVSTVNPDKKLLALILKRSSSKGNKAADCYPELAQASDYEVSLSSQGMVFEPYLAHAIQACSETITIPYTALTPFLSAMGQREVNAIKQNGF